MALLLRSCFTLCCLDVMLRGHYCDASLNIRRYADRGLGFCCRTGVTRAAAVAMASWAASALYSPLRPTRPTLWPADRTSPSWEASSPGPEVTSSTQSCCV